MLALIKEVRCQPKKGTANLSGVKAFYKDIV